MGVVSVKHSFAAGDLISSLPGFKKINHDTGKVFKIYQWLDFPANYYDNAVHSTFDLNGNGVCMNDHVFNFLKPLLESQNYIESFEVWNGEKIDLDLDLTRLDNTIPMPSGILHQYPVATFPELNSDLSKPWIDVKDNEYFYDSGTSGNIIINRTQRYHNPYINYFFLKKYIGRIVFTGTEKEHDIFCAQWGIKKGELPLIKISNFYDLAIAMKRAKGFLGNQSFCWHLADAMKIPRILELCAVFPNTFPHGAHGHAFYKQGALEFYFEQMLKK